MKDRFFGEAVEPPVWSRCDYCADTIYTGSEYWFYEGQIICDGCARRYSWALFEQRAQRRMAKRDV